MSRELLKRALESMRRTRSIPTGESIDTMSAIEDELAKPDPEPVAYITGWYGGYPTIQVIDDAVLPNGTPLYAAPPDQSARIAELEKQLVELQAIRGKCTLVPTDKLENMQRKLKERKPIGYIPAYAARIIHNEGAWDAFHLYKTQTDPTDIEVFL